jgi:predicted aspartyl protease
MSQRAYLPFLPRLSKKLEPPPFPFQYHPTGRGGEIGPTPTPPLRKQLYYLDLANMSVTTTEWINHTAWDTETLSGEQFSEEQLSEDLWSDSEQHLSSLCPWKEEIIVTLDDCAKTNRQNADNVSLPLDGSMFVCINNNLKTATMDRSVTTNDHDHKEVDGPDFEIEAQVPHENAWQDSRVRISHPPGAQHTYDAVIVAQRRASAHRSQGPGKLQVIRTRDMNGNLKKSSRQGLPLVFDLGANKEIIMTGHDTGTEANHMSLELAKRLGYEIDKRDASKGQFQLPNGKIIKAIGKVSARVQFAQGQDAQTTSLTCYFNVFSHLALPALIGMAFLNATETMSKYTSRLATLPSGWKRSLRLCAVGNATNQVACLIDGREVKATADTGAEIALVSGEYAMRYGLLQYPGCEELELADGSREYTSGFGDVKLAVKIRDAGTKEDWITKTVRFHVLNNLHLDVILDEEMVEDFDIFRSGMNSVMSVATGFMPSLGTIFHLGSVEKAILCNYDKLKMRLSSLWSSKPDASSK